MNIQRFIVVVIGCVLLAGGAACGRASEARGVLRDFMVRTWPKADDGLPDDSVTSLLQTRDGYLWLGTGTGLVRFDGVKFTKTPLLRQGVNEPVVITALNEDEEGRLWIGTQAQGLFCRLPGLWASGTVEHYDKSSGLLDESITSLTTDADGRLWIGTPHGVNRWAGGSFASFTARDGLPDDFVSSVHAGRSGTVWITTRGGICQCNQDRITPFSLPGAATEREPEFLGAYEVVRSNLLVFCPTHFILINLAAPAEGKRINYFPGEKSASIRVWSWCEGRNGRLWIGASGRGVFCLDGVDFQPVMVNQGRWPNDVRAICEDHEGNLWLGISGGGLTQLRSQSFVLLKGSAGLPPGAATCLALDTGGRVCVGMESGGVYALIGEDFEKLADDTRVLGQDLPLSLCAGSDGSLWVSTMGTGLYRLRNGRAAACTTANGLSDDCVLTVCTEANGTVWAGTQAGALHRLGNGGLTTFGTSDGLPGTPLTALLPARGGGLWVGSGNGVVLRSDAEFKNVSPVQLSPKLNGKSILSLYEDGQRNLWVGTGGGGLACVDGARCSSWDSQDGLPDDVISGIVEDGEANLWLMTDQGLCRLARGSLSQGPTGRAPLKTRLLFETEAANANRAPNVGGPRALRATDGRLWFATSGGLVGIDTRGWAAEKPAPQVHLEAVLVNKRPLDFATRSAGSNHGDGNAEPIRLPASLRELEFQFTALSFEAPEKVRFRHKLERLNTDWIETGPERRVSYGRLPSGTYEFHVTACNAEGVWNETGASLAFIIPTPLWRAPWALGLYGLSAAGGVAGTVRLVSHRRLRRRLARLEQQQATERERVRIAQDMHDEIGSKLTKISFLSERAKVELPGKGPLAEKLDSIAGTSRELLQALDEIVWAVNPRNDTLEQLGAYLSQYAREYFHNTPIECDVSLQGELPHLAMSADTRHNLFLAFEEALNNVLKHAGASRVQVEIRAEDEKLQIKVVDNGHGFKLNVGSSPNSPPVEQSREPDAAAATEGNGLVNMRQRLADIGGQCDVSSIVGQGTTVCLCTSLSSAKLSFP